MESETVLQVRMDKETKDSVEKLYREMGITFASAVRLFAKQSLVEQRMPFVVSKKTMKKICDANIILRYLIKDDEKLFDIAKKEIQKCPIVPTVILAEIVYVLKGVYKVP